MIAGVRGVLEAISGDAVVVGVGGFSVRVLVPASTLRRLGAVGEAVQLRTHLYVREDVLALYGFATDEEIQLFETLLTVSGVGPQLALSILSAASPEAIRSAIAAGDADALSRIPGLGKKLAGRLILELKGKIAAPAAPTPLPTASAVDSDVLAALTGLGYSTADAQAALRALPDDPTLSLEDKILHALRYFARQS